MQWRTAGRIAAREVCVFLIFLLLAIVFTWPLARHISTLVSDLGDPLLNAWIIDWDCYSLTHSPLHLYDAPIYYPGKYPLAYSENLVGAALLVLPFWLAGLGPITVYNITMLLGFALSGYGTYVLARMVVGSFPGAIAAGVFFAFAPFKFDHLAHVQIICSGWLPLMFAALIAYWRAPSSRRAVLLGAAFVMNGLTNVHYFLFGSVTLALTVIFLAIVQPGRDRRFWLTLAIALVAGSLVLLPFMLPYRVVSNLYGMRRGVDETYGNSATWNDWLVAFGRSRWYGRLPPPSSIYPERHLFTGLVALFLAGFGFFLRHRDASPAMTLTPLTPRRRLLVRWLDVIMILSAPGVYFGAVMDKVKWTAGGKQLLAFGTATLPATVLVVAAIIRFSIRLPRALARDGDQSLATVVARSRFTAEEWCATLWMIIGLLGSFGMKAFFHSFLYRYVEVFQSIRVPARWAVIANIGLAVWMAIGIDEIVRRVRTPRWRTAVASALIALSIVDLAEIIRWEAVPEIEPVYRWIASERVRGPILELPMSDNGLQYRYLLGATVHRTPIMNGVSGFETPLHEQLRIKGERSEFDDNFTDTIERNGARFVIVHGDFLRFQVNGTFRWLQRELARGHLAFIRRLDHGTNGDWVFAVPRNATDWQRLRAPEVPDPAGHTPRQNLARLFARQHTYNESTFGYVDSPRTWSEVRGPMEISGWALSPKGIRRVIVHLGNDSYAYDAELVPRSDISTYFALYPRTTRAGFRLRLPKRPRGMVVDTNIQIEIIDGAGHSTRLSDMPIFWR